VVALASDAFVALVMILACSIRIVQLQSIQAHRPVSPTALRGGNLFFAAGAGIDLLVGLLTVVTFLLWIYRAHQNLLSFRPAPLRYSAAAAVYYFFIPFFSLFRPYLIMREIWVKSDPSLPPFAVPTYTKAPASPLVATWWALFLARVGIGWIFLILRQEESTAGALLANTSLLSVSYCVSILTAIPACLLVIRILRREENLAEQLTALAGVDVF
jgi:hypothetical protein